jgi:two-component system nitrogen regulation response regulator GlnG
VAAGRFRADLYFRLRVCTVRLPPLRERGDDLALLVDYHLRRSARELGKSVQGLTPEALEALRRHDWPGNVRELQSVLKQALLAAHGPLLLPDDLPLEQLRPAAPAEAADWDRFVQGLLEAGGEDVYARCLEEMERRVLTRVLQHTGGNQVQAARLLGINRGSLRAKIRALRITIGRSVWADDEAAGPG